MNFSFLVFLSETQSSFKAGPNSATFNVKECTANLSFTIMNEEYCLLSLSYLNGFYCSPVVSIQAFSRHFDADSKISLQKVASKDNIAIEFNAEGIPETLAFCMLQSKTKSYLTLDLKKIEVGSLIIDYYQPQSCRNFILGEAESLESIPVVRKMISDLKEISVKVDNQDCLIADFNCRINNLHIEHNHQNADIDAAKDQELEVSSFKNTLNEVTESLEDVKIKLAKLKNKLIEVELSSNSHHEESSAILEELRQYVQNLEISSKNIFKNVLEYNASLTSYKQELNHTAIKISEDLASLDHKFQNEIISLKSNQSAFIESPSNFGDKTNAIHNCPLSFQQYNVQVLKIENELSFLKDQLSTILHITERFKDLCIAGKIDKLIENNELRIMGSAIPQEGNELSNLKEIVRIQGYSSVNYEIHHDKEFICVVNLSESEYIVGCSDGSYEIRYKSTHSVKYESPSLHTALIRVMIIVDSMLITGSYDFTIRIWNLNEKDQKFSPLLGHKDIIISLVHLKENMIASGSCDKFIIIWDISSFTIICNIADSTLGPVYGLIKYDQGDFISVSSDGSIRFWVTKDKTCWKEVASKRINSDQCLRSVCSLTKDIIAVGTMSGEICVWDIEKKQVHYLIGHTGMINKIVALDKNLIASCSDDRTIRIWDIQTFRQIMVLNGHKSYVWGIITLNEFQFLSVSSDCRIRIWGQGR